MSYVPSAPPVGDEIFLLKMGEMVLKGLNRRSFEDKLIANVRRRVRRCGEFHVYSKQSTIYVEPLSDQCDVEAAYAACRECGVAAETIGGAVGGYVLKNGRMQTFRLGARHGTLLTSKHENSIAYDTNLRYIRAAQEPCTVLVIVDAVSRKYFTSETSWLWDIDFDQLNAPQVQRIILSGRYCNDLAERFSFTDIPREKVTVQADIPAAAAELKADGSENVYVVTCFSDRDKILSQVVKEA